MFKIIGIVLIAFAVMSVLKVSLKQKKLNSQTICKCEAHVVENVPGPLIANVPSFYPVYEYVYKDEKKRLQSKMPLTSPLPIGEKLTIYVDTITEKTIDRASILTEAVFTLLFGALGFVFIILGKFR